jgi:chromosome segregation ATPase
MDQSLVAYFDERFRASSREIIEQVVQQIQSLREETLRRFEQVDARFEQVDARFEQVDARFGQVDARFEKVDRQFGEARETARLTLVLVEDVRHQIQQVAEGYRGCDDKLARIEGDREHYVRSIHMDDPIKDLDNRVGILEGWVDRHREVVGESIRRLAAGNPPPPIPSK